MISKMKIFFKKIFLLIILIKHKIVRYWEKHTLGITLTLLILLFFVALFWKSMFISLDSGQQGIRWSRFDGTRLDEYYGEGLTVIFLVTVQPVPSE